VVWGDVATSLEVAGSTCDCGKIAAAMGVMYVRPAWQ
jgi:hypothetical protein